MDEFDCRTAQGAKDWLATESSRFGAIGHEPMRAAMWNCANVVAELQTQLNAARLEICALRASSTNANHATDAEMAAYAASRGWNCCNEMDEP